MVKTLKNILLENQQFYDLENGLGHMTKMAVMPIYGYFYFLKISFRTQSPINDLETWHAALENQALQSLYK